jgi:hypothetical protein
MDAATTEQEVVKTGPEGAQNRPDLVVIALGGGVQSTVLALMAGAGDIGPMPDCAIFADTLWERAATYAHLRWLAGELPFPIHTVSTGSTRDRALAGGFNGIPFHVRRADGSKGMGVQDCTTRHKIEPMRAKMRELLGVRKGQWMRGRVEMWLGISTDEITRMKDARQPWLRHRWPLIERRMTRADCQGWFARRYPGRALVKSSCVGCPFHSTALWRELRDTDPAGFADAVAVDAAIRRGRGGVQQFMHHSCTPLAEAIDAADRQAGAQREFAFEQECEGMCGV